MNKKKEQERADVYIKTRATKQFKEDFKKCCEADGKDMSSVLDELIKEYMLKSIRKVIKRD